MRSWRSQSRDQRLYLTASALSFLGDGMRYAALPLLATRYGLGPAGLGLLLGFATLPFLLIGLFGGMLADRMPRRTLLIICDAARVVITAMFVLTALSGYVPFAALCTMAFLMGSLESVATSATFAYVPSLAAAGDLERANSMLTTALVTGRTLLGPLAGAALVGVMPTLPFILDGITFTISAALLSTIRTSPRPAPRTGPGGVRSVVTDLLTAARWLRGTPPARIIACSAAVINLFNMGALAVQPFYAAHVLNGTGIVYGVMMTSTAAGGIAGAQAVRLVVDRLAPGSIVAVALIFIGCGYLAVAGAPYPLIAYTGLFMVGMGFAAWATSTTSWRQRVTPGEMLGRADGLHRAVAWGANPIGSVLGGLLFARGGYRLPFLFVGLVALLLVPVFLRRGNDGPVVAENLVRAGHRGAADLQ